MSDGLLSTREAASRLRRSEQWVRNAARDGDLDSLVERLRGGRTRYRFTVESIEQYLKAHGPASGTGSTPETPTTSAPPLRLVEPTAAATTASAGSEGEGAVLTMPTPSSHDVHQHADDAELADSSFWIDHYREEITRYRLRVAELERTVDEMFVTAGEKDDEIRRLCDVIRRLLPDDHS